MYFFAEWPMGLYSIYLSTYLSVYLIFNPTVNATVSQKATETWRSSFLISFFLFCCLQQENNFETDKYALLLLFFYKRFELCVTLHPLLHMWITLYKGIQSFLSSNLNKRLK